MLGPKPPTSSPRRSCENCRTKKRKCNGDLPSCTRCLRLGLRCEYFQSLPMGRPRKGAVRVSVTAGEPRDGIPKAPHKRTLRSTLSHLSQDILADSENSTTSTETQHLGLEQSAKLLSATSFDPLGFVSDASSRACPPFQLEQRLSNIEGGEYLQRPVQTYDIDGTFDINLSRPLASGFDARSNAGSCACLATIYLLLEEIQEQTDTTYLERMQHLRGVTQKAVGIVQCPVCPLRYMSLSQNVSMLCALMFSVANAYSNVIEFIDRESDGSPGSTKSAAKAKALVRQEIFGVPTGNHTFSSLLDIFESRQGRWHEKPPCEDYPAMYIHGREKQPLCITSSVEARKIVQLLEI